MSDDRFDLIFTNAIKIRVYCTIALAVVGAISLINLVGAWIW